LEIIRVWQKIFWEVKLQILNTYLLKKVGSNSTYANIVSYQYPIFGTHLLRKNVNNKSIRCRNGNLVKHRKTK
jgi:hypothetical protein